MSIITVIEELVVRRRTVTIGTSDVLALLTVELVASEITPAHFPPEPEAAGYTLSDPRRWRYTGKVDDYGALEVVDRRTGRRGVMFNDFGCGFNPGAYVCRDGRVGFDHPGDNPFAGCDWGG